MLFALAGNLPGGGPPGVRMEEYVLKGQRFLAACRRQRVDSTPVWLMRQAGRYLPQYRKVRARAGGFLDLCKSPELACEVTIQPVEALGVDAAIIFADILLPVEAMGVPLKFSDGEGPILEPVRSLQDLKVLHVPDPVVEIGFVMDAIGLTVNELSNDIPLIGFSGAPFTLATYVVEGGTSRRFRHVLEWMYSDPEGFRSLLDLLTETVILYLRAQIEAGAGAVQLFDTWAGILSRRTYVEFALRPTARIVEALSGLNVPVILYAKGSSPFLEEMVATGADVLSVDWRISLAEASARTRGAVSLQGNLDPMVLFAPESVLEEEVRRILAEAPKTGHVFNLGHGIQPETPVEKAKALVAMVHEMSRREPMVSRAGDD